MLNFIDQDLIIDVNKELGYSVLNRSLVGSAISSWHYYTNPKEQIASIVSGIVKNHAFRDGNKRTAVLMYYTMCSELKIKPKSDNDMFKIILQIANNKYSIKEVTNLLFLVI